MKQGLRVRGENGIGEARGREQERGGMREWVKEGVAERGGRGSGGGDVKFGDGEGEGGRDEVVEVEEGWERER